MNEDARRIRYSKMPWDVSDEFDEKIVDKIMENKF